MEYHDLLRIISGLRTDHQETGRHLLVMIGGVHGSGKSYICEKLVRDLPFVTCVSASRLLEHFGNAKHVDNVTDNQKCLAEHIKKIKEYNALTVVDGHFCVIDKEDVFHYVSKEIFQSLSPSLLVLVMAPTSIIQQRILLRDHIEYSLPFIEKMKQNEAYWAAYTSDAFNIPLYHVIG